MPQLPRTGVSIREFARLDGCSHTAVQNALKSGHLKLLPQGGLDPALAGSNWRPGNYKPIRGGKPRTAKRQVATAARQPVSVELPASTAAPLAAELQHWSSSGFLGGLANLGCDVPAIAAEIAQRHGLGASAVSPFFEELRATTSATIAALLVEHRIGPDHVEDFTCSEGEVFTGELLTPDDYRRPGETEDQKWERLIPAQAA